MQQIQSNCLVIDLNAAVILLLLSLFCADWEDVDAYYAGSSSAKRIPAVRLPLLCIQALDDPIAPAEAIPCDAIQDNPYCMLAGEGTVLRLVEGVMHLVKPCWLLGQPTCAARWQGIEATTALACVMK